MKRFLRDRRDRRAVDVVIVGVGRMGQAHLQALTDHEDFSVRGVVDSDPERLQALPGGIESARDCRTFFRNGTADAAFLSLPHDTYPEIRRQALAAGLHIVQEKPLGRDLEEARGAVEECRRAGRRLIVLGQLGWHPVFLGLRERVREGRYGEILMTTMTNTFRWPPAFQGQMGWRADVSRSGGVALLDAGWHGIAMLLDLHGTPERVSAHLRCGGIPGIPDEVDTCAIVTLRFPSGVIGEAISSFVVGPQQFRLVVHGSDGSCTFDGRDRVDHIPGREEEIRETGPDHRSKEALLHQLDAVRDLLGGPGTSWEDHASSELRVQAVIEAARQSDREGGLPIPVSCEGIGA